MNELIPNNTIASPLPEADPISLDELFDRDPLELTKANIEQIIQSFRAQRLTWEQEEKAAAKTGRKPSTKISKEAAAKLTLSSLDLKLDI